MKKSEIITAMIALYGAVLSTVASIRQWKSDRVRVKIAVKRNRQMINAPRYAGITLVEIQITNVGHRPATIRSFGTIGLHPHSSLAGVDSQPQLPCEIREGQFISSYWPQADLNFSTIDYWVVWDSEDRVYRLRQASRLKHWKSVWQQRRAWKQQATSAAAK